MNNISDGGCVYICIGTNKHGGEKTTNMKITELKVGDIVQYLDDDKLITVEVRKIDGDGDIVGLKQSNGHRFNVMVDSLIPIK